MPIQKDDVGIVQMQTKLIDSTADNMLDSLKIFYKSTKSSADNASTEQEFHGSLAVLKSLDEGLGPSIDKLPKIKPEALSKDVKAILKVVASYKVKVSKFAFVKEALLIVLKDMETYLGKIANAEGDLKENLKKLATARDTWSDRKTKATTTAAKYVKELDVATKSTLSDTLLRIKEMTKAHESSVKLVKLLQSFLILDGGKQDMLAPKLIISLQKLDSDIYAVAQQEGGGPIDQYLSEMQHAIAAVVAALKRV